MTFSRKSAKGKEQGRERNNSPDTPNGQGRKWFKVWVTPWLTGTVRYTLDHRDRAVWMDLLALASQSRTSGVICAGFESGTRVGIPLLSLAGITNVPEVDLNTILAKFEQQERIKITLDASKRLIIAILKWSEYQADYSKQARYRERKRNSQPSRLPSDYPKVTTPTTAEGDGEGEGEGEEEEKRRRTAAAFASMNCEPYGTKDFQKIWEEEQRSGTSRTFADAMERCIQRCRSRKIKIPGRFFAHKREIEKVEAGNNYRRAPL